MGTRSGYAFRWLVMVVLISSIVGDLIEADECKDELKAVFIRPTLSTIGVQLTDKYKETGTYFVYSEMKIFDKLFNLYNMGSEEVRVDLQRFIDFDFSNCDHIRMCKIFNEIIGNMNNRQTYHFFQYASSTFYQSSYRQGFYHCTTRKENRLNFKSNPRDVLSRIGNKYTLYSQYSCNLYNNLNPDTNFFLLDSLKVSPELFLAVGTLKTNIEFEDLDGVKNNMTWVKLEAGAETVNKRRDPKSHRCSQYVEITRYELRGGIFYMMYFRPKFTSEEGQDIRIKSIKNIFFDLRYFVDQATTYKTNYYWRKYKYLAVPDMDFSSEVDLKPLLEEKMPNLFCQHHITNLYDNPTSLSELRTWEYMKITPPNFHRSPPGTDDAKTMYIKSSFVFALVDKDTNIILKTGAYLSPLLDYI